MRNPALALVVAASLLLGASPQAAQAARSRNRSNSLGGSARRAASGGEALAQSFYERAVLLGKQGQYGQASKLMGTVVQKNPSNDKYRYYHALLLYKIGDFGEAASECRRLERASLERYRRKGSALAERIQGIQSGEIATVQPLRAPGGVPVGAARLERMGTLPESAYMNVANMASKAAAGEMPKVAVRAGPALSSAAYRNQQGAMADEMANAATRAVETASAAAAPPPATDANPFSDEQGWADPTEVKPPPAAPAATKPAATKPAASKPPPADNPFEPTDSAFADTAFADGGGFTEDVWGDDGAAAKKPAPPKPAPKPAAKPPPPTKAPPPAKKPEPPKVAAKPAEEGGFEDGGFGDFGSFDEPAAKKPEPAKPAPKPAAKPATKPAGGGGDFEDGFGDAGGFGDFEGF